MAVYPRISAGVALGPGPAPVLVSASSCAVVRHEIIPQSVLHGPARCPVSAAYDDDHGSASGIVVQTRQIDSCLHLFSLYSLRHTDITEPRIKTHMIVSPIAWTTSRCEY